MTSAIIGIDVGATTAKGVAVDPHGRILARGSRATGSAQPAVDGVLSLARDLKETVGSQCAGLAAAGVVVPGMIDEAGSTVRFASNLAWSDLPLADLVRQELGVPTRLANDATSAGLAEGRFGAARGAANYVHIAIGTGIGACVVADGEVLRGRSRGAGEIGHTTVVPDGELCTCGRSGCLDAYAGAAGIIRRYARISGTDDVSVPEIVERSGTDAMAGLVWGDAIRALGRAIATLTMTLDTELVVLGGGVARAGAALFAPLRTMVGADLVWKLPPRIEPSELGAMAGLSGALTVALMNLEPGEFRRWPLDQLPRAEP